MGASSPGNAADVIRERDPTVLIAAGTRAVKVVKREKALRHMAAQDRKHIRCVSAISLNAGRPSWQTKEEKIGKLYR
jgi:hypothetical protein